MSVSNMHGQKLIAFYLFFILGKVVATTEEMKCNSTMPVEEESVVLQLLNIAGNILESAKKYEGLKKRFAIPHCSCEKPMDCAEILEANSLAKNGIYQIWPRSRMFDGPVDVYCDMEDDGGAWTVIQRRGDFGSEKEYFYKDWNDYKKGFGDLQKDFWLGNDIIHALTNQRSNMVKFILFDWDKNETYASYNEFWIEDGTRKYISHVTGYTGTAGDSFSFTNGNMFSTKDQDNDIFDKNCAVEFKGAWWYTKCHSSNLNGMYLRGEHSTYADGVNWNSFKGFNYSLKETVIKVRPKISKKTPAETTPH